MRRFIGTWPTTNHSPHDSRCPYVDHHAAVGRAAKRMKVDGHNRRDYRRYLGLGRAIIFRDLLRVVAAHVIYQIRG